MGIGKSRAPKYQEIPRVRYYGFPAAGSIVSISPVRSPRPLEPNRRHLDLNPKP